MQFHLLLIAGLLQIKTWNLDWTALDHGLKSGLIAFLSRPVERLIQAQFPERNAVGPESSPVSRFCKDPIICYTNEPFFFARRINYTNTYTVQQLTQHNSTQYNNIHNTTTHTYKTS